MERYGRRDLPTIASEMKKTGRDIWSTFGGIQSMQGWLKISFFVNSLGFQAENSLRG
jgi:hypothetical protein